MLSIILWIGFGALAGWIATIIAGKGDQHGAFGNIVIGIVGAMLGGFAFELLGGSGLTGFNLYSLMVAILGSLVVLFFVNMIRGQGRGSTSRSTL